MEVSEQAMGNGKVKKREAKLAIHQPAFGKELRNQKR